MTTGLGPARDGVRDAIRQLVIGGELRPGDRLVERRLAERLGVSRVPVREALRQLVHEGFAEERTTGGMAVRHLGAGEVETLFEVRAALEELVCRRLVEGPAEALDEAADLVDRARAAVRRGDTREAVALNAAFHAALVAAAGSGVLTAVMEPVAGRMQWLLSQHDDVASIVAEHGQILRALRERDLSEALRLTAEHLVTSRVAARTHGGDVAAPGAPARP